MSNPHPEFRRGFTIMEMIVSIGILVLVILSVGVIFQNAGRTVGVSQASMEMLSNSRAINQQIESDVSGMDKNCFLVIRCASFTDPVTGVTRRCDQVSFISRGSFTNRTGVNSTNAFTDNYTTVPAAFVWWGQLAFQKQNGNNASPTNPRVYLNEATPDYVVPLNQVPNGPLDSTNVSNGEEGLYTLGRHTTLLVPKNSSSDNVNPAGTGDGSIPSYGFQASLSAIDYNNTDLVNSGASTEPKYNITQSRIAVAQGMPSQIMSYVVGTLGITRSTSNARYEADHFCYRYAALRSPAESSVGLVNGYFRMHPIALQGVSSIAIDWTDGSVYGTTGQYTSQDGQIKPEIDVTTGQTVSSSLANTTRWFGMYDATAGLSKGVSYNPDPATSVVDRAVAAASTTTTIDNAHGDKYAAVFSYDNRYTEATNRWPVALRIRYHIADPTGRLQNGRDFVEVVKLPD